MTLSMLGMYMSRGEEMLIEKSQGHLFFYQVPGGVTRELLIVGGEVKSAPTINVLDNKNRIGRFECWADNKSNMDFLFDSLDRYRFKTCRKCNREYLNGEINLYTGPTRGICDDCLKEAKNES